MLCYCQLFLWVSLFVTNVESSGQPKLHFPASKFEEIMNILRHEEPLYISLVSSNGIGTISTSIEPIGEDESD